MATPRIRLVTRGDDAGSAHAANAAVLEAYREGILRNASIMVPAPFIEGAALLLAGEKGLCCGLHTTLTAEWDRVRWGPVLPPEKIPSLVQSDGTFFPTTRALQERGPVAAEILAEIQAQLDRARALGFDMRYLDMHMGWGWVIPGIEEQVARWCEREGLVYPRTDLASLPRVASETDPIARFLAALDAAAPGDYLLVTHPAHDTEEMRLLGHAGYSGEQVVAERDGDRCLLTDPQVVARCRAEEVARCRAEEVALLRYDQLDDRG
jgi:predicted glycoside hydrolase/deacetylase ChbG (UPF0249 family)